MRPRKHILVIDPLSDRCGITSFVLETMGHYYAICTASIYEAAEVACDCTPDLLLAFAPVSESYLMEVAAGLYLPWLFIAPDSETGRCWPKMADVLERVKVATARKRGPMRGMKRAPMTVKPALAEACA